jgi:hypothetical protein
MKVNKLKLFLSLLILTLMTTPLAIGQINSLATWEPISDGTLDNTWVENETADWKPQNVSGVWEYNCSVTADVSFTFNESVNADRWMSTFEVVSDDSEAGVGSVMVNNLTSYYAIVYYYVSTDHGPGGPQCHLMCYDTDHFDYWNGTGFESNASNASDLDNDWEKEYSNGDFFRVKVMWDFHSTIGCSLHFKMWDPAGDEYPLWMVDLEFPNHPSITTTTFKSGLFVDSRYDLDASETDFRRIFFWDTEYDLYAPSLPIVNEYIACPTIDCFDVYDIYNEYSDLDPDDIYNASQLFKEYVNLWDLQVIYSEDFYDGALLPFNQNDSLYLFSLMFTDTRDFYESMFGPGLPDDFPDNMEMTHFLAPIDGTSNNSDCLLLRIDTDNNGLYDSYDYAIWSNDSDLILYQGWTPFTDAFFADMWSGGVYTGDFGEVFRDKQYYEWQVFINWDKIYNGSSGNRVGDDLVRISISLYDNDTDVTVLLQDYDRTDDANPYPATDGRNVSRDPTWEEYNDSSNWIYFQVDTSISGEPLADPEDPPAPVTWEDSLSAITEALYAFIVIIFILGLIGLVMKSFERWGK